MESINRIQTIMDENKKVFTRFVQYIGGRTGIEFYVPKRLISKFTLHHHHIISVESNIRSITKNDSRLDYSKVSKQSEFKDFYKVTLCPKYMDKLDIFSIQGYRHTKFIIVDNNVPVWKLTVNTKGIVILAEFYDLPHYTSLYKNISNVFIDTIGIYDCEDGVNKGIQLQCMYLVGGQLYQQEVPLYLIPSTVYRNEAVVFNIMRELHNNLLLETVDQRPKTVHTHTGFRIVGEVN